MIEKGADDWWLGLCGAAKGGHISIVDLMIENGANNWDEAIFEAERRGHSGIVELLECERKHYYYRYNNYFYWD